MNRVENDIQRDIDSSYRRLTQARQTNNINEKIDSIRSLIDFQNEMLQYQTKRYDTEREPYKQSLGKHMEVTTKSIIQNQRLLDSYIKQMENPNNTGNTNNNNTNNKANKYLKYKMKYLLLKNKLNYK